MTKSRASLPCSVMSKRPELGFDLTLHTGYAVRLRQRDIAGNGNVLTATFRVSSQSNPGRWILFEQRWSVPPLDKREGGSVTLDGEFALGEGQYHVDWVMQDQVKRRCFSSWKITARMPDKLAGTAPGLEPGFAAPIGEGRRKQTADPGTANERPINVAVLVNFGSPTSGPAILPLADSTAMLHMLRTIAGDPRIGGVSITAFNLDLGRVIYKQERPAEIDFNGLKKAVETSNPGTITIGQLASKNSEARFLVDLAAQEVRQNDSDALIFVGPRTADLGGSMSGDLMRQLGESSVPIFYLSFTTVADWSPWRDVTGAAVRYLRGHEFVISTPRDLISAWSKIMTQLSKGDFARRQSGN